MGSSSARVMEGVGGVVEEGSVEEGVLDDADDGEVVIMVVGDGMF